ncbi:MAG: homoserine dehydrogenase [Armatimonadota bacterium]|nr:homoserine dehydrogenase [Armatimonadota bacterium]MDR7449619.1 homoserine dehydrogenase [Armatimonadota bacterium]MDR7460342.1 homoserine dehydrogenase [Armatimonadota bacterium]MDR7488076.1 homoserine dehydrogenase [Armatimonadota bacterium]MDR7492111.1 homoserine dehydrogenase [Armatimonadota bacterium]
MEVGVGLLGFGAVGAQVYRLLEEGAERIARRTGWRPTVRRIAVLDPARPRPHPLPAHLLAPDAAAVVGDPQVEVVVEVMGGLEPARTLVLEALRRGKAVVTANKRLLATHGAEVFAAAAATQAPLAFEGAVGGAIPIVKPLRETLAADRVRVVEGILNGTTNFVLTRMTRDGWSFADALAEAQRRGFAEADASEDVGGHDAAAKLAILASLAFDAALTDADVFREGIQEVAPRDIAYARELGYVVKLLAVGRDLGEAVDVRVHPALIPQTHPLATVEEERNAILVVGERAGPLVLSGPGAGGAATAAVVVGDILDAAGRRRRGSGEAEPALRPAGAPARRPVWPVEDLVIPYYFGLQVTDRPGVFARVAAVFGEEEVSIASIVQKSRGAVADVVLLTHEAREAAVRRVVARLRAMDVVKSVDSVIRVVE